MNRNVTRLAHFIAYLGGLVLLALIALTCLSIVGRMTNSIMHSALMQSNMPGFANWILELGVGPINGDYELVEAGMAFAIFAFLPLCQISVAHASVDMFMEFLPRALARFLVWFSEVLFALVLILIAYQLFNGTMDKYNSGETTLLLETPVWWSYGFSMAGAVIAALAGVYMAILRSMELATGTQIILGEMGAEH